jgi:hypothetical protein
MQGEKFTYVSGPITIPITSLFTFFPLLALYEYYISDQPKTMHGSIACFSFIVCVIIGCWVRERIIKIKGYVRVSDFYQGD